MSATILGFIVSDFFFSHKILAFQKLHPAGTDFQAVVWGIHQLDPLEPCSYLEFANINFKERRVRLNDTSCSFFWKIDRKKSKMFLKNRFSILLAISF